MEGGRDVGLELPPRCESRLSTASLSMEERTDVLCNADGEAAAGAALNLEEALSVPLRPRDEDDVEDEGICCDDAAAAALC